MNKSKLSIEQKRANTDLNVIISITLTVMVVYMLFKSQIISFIMNKNFPLLLRTFIAALFEWGIAGLGIIVVALYRKESFIRFGLTKTNLFKTIALTTLTFIPYIILIWATDSFTGYLPFKRVIITKEWLEVGFPYNMVGMSIITIVWGFFEGFNYVIISHKINMIYPPKNIWLNWGAISCGIACLLLHVMAGVSIYGLMEGLAVFIIIYGMLVIKDYTKNAWGCIAIFTFFWNAI